MTDIYDSLVKIVGERHVSAESEELYFYSRDPGLMPAHKPNYVVAPKTTQEVREILMVANRLKIPIVPMGGGISLSGLVVPLKGGIVLDMKRMRRILSVDERARCAIVEGGTPYGMLIAYLEKNHRNLMVSIPDSPPASTIAANVALHGQGHLAQQYGFNSDMVSGLEVVLPNGEICRIGSCSMSPDWFSKGPPLPDLSGLFLGWLGTTGVITKVGLRLCPKKKIRDLIIFITDIVDLVPDILLRLTHTEMAENIGLIHDEDAFRDNHLIAINMTGDTSDEIDFKRKTVWDSVRKYFDSKDGGFLDPFPAMKAMLLEMPLKMITRTADIKRGGGFQYCGPIISTQRYPAVVKKTKELVARYGLSFSAMSRVIDGGQSVMFGMGFPFNRADAEMMAVIEKALHEWIGMAFDQGAIPWKPNKDEQKMAMDRMDPNTLKIMKMIKDNLDPNGIMNPGNWEVQ